MFVSPSAPFPAKVAVEPKARKATIQINHCRVKREMSRLKEITDLVFTDCFNFSLFVISHQPCQQLTELGMTIVGCIGFRSTDQRAHHWSTRRLLQKLPWAF